MSYAPGGFDQTVFLNCPYDDEYRPLLGALLFTVLDCGLTPRVASDQADSGQLRLEKIRELIRGSRFSGIGSESPPERVFPVAAVFGIATISSPAISRFP